MLTFIIIAAAVIAILIGIFAFARIFNQNGSKNAGPAKTTASITGEQSLELKQAHSQLVSIRMQSSRIADKDIRQGLVGACDSIEKVLSTLKEKPEKIQTSGQLFNYYLPTLEKVISKYQRLESSGVDNEQIPDKLRKYLTDVTSAMGSMYEGMFANDKLHVEVDMEAMTMAIKRDGLLDEEDFKTSVR